MGSVAGGSTAPRTGSVNGRYTFHLPNGWSRRPLDDEREGEDRNGGADAGADADDQGAHHDDDDAATANGLYKSLAQTDVEEEIDGADEMQGNESYQWEGDPSVSPLGRLAVLAAFGVLGAAVLLPFNSLVTPSEYYRYLLEGSPRANGFMSWILVSFNVATIAVGAHAAVSMHQTTPARRIYFSATSILLSLLLLTLFTMIDVNKSKSNANLVFTALLIFTFIIASATAYLQNAVVALCSIFGGRTMGLMLSGQGLVGLLISIVQLIAAMSKTETANVTEDLEQVSRAATIFFSFSTAFMAFAIATFIWLARLRLYQKTCREFEAIRRQEEPSAQSGRRPHTMRSNGDNSDDSDNALIQRLPIAIRPRARHILDIQSKLKGLSFAIFYVFTVTLSLFPALTSRVVSVSDKEDSWKRPLIFVAWHFVTFNGFDLLGRLLPSLSPTLFLIKSPRTLVTFSASRTLFIPLLLACNVRSSSQKGGVLASPLPDWAFFTIVAIFALSNGLVSTGAMVSGPANGELQNDHHRATAGAILNFWLAAGLAMGSFVSFAVGAVA